MARSLLIRADHDEQLPNKAFCCTLVLVLVLVLVLIVIEVEVVSEMASSTYENRCVRSTMLFLSVLVVDAAWSFAARARNESCTRPSHSIAMEAVGAMEGVIEGETVGFGTGALVGFPGVGVGATVGFLVGYAVGHAVGFAVGLGVGEGVGIAVGVVLGRAVGCSVG